MSYFYDRFETNPIHEMEREEARDAQRFADGFGSCPPGQHRYVPNGRGGGTCRECGDELRADEL